MSETVPTTELLLEAALDRVGIVPDGETPQKARARRRRRVTRLINEFHERMMTILLHYQAGAPKTELERTKPNESSICEGCASLCCTKSFKFSHMMLTLEEAQMPEFRDLAKPDPRDPLEYRYPLKDGCPHLDRTTFRCTIYEKRPMTCRGFSCYKQANAGNYGVRDRIKKLPELDQLLRSNNLLKYDPD